MATKKETNGNEPVTKEQDGIRTVRVMSGTILAGRYLTNFTIWKLFKPKHHMDGLYRLRAVSVHSNWTLHYKSVEDALKELVQREGAWE